MTNYYFFVSRFSSESGKMKLFFLPGQKYLTAGGREVVSDKEKLSRYDPTTFCIDEYLEGIFFAAEKIKDFGASFSIESNIIPIVPSDLHFTSLPKDVQEDILLQWKEYQSEVKPIVENRENNRINVNKGTLFDKLKKEHPVPTIDKDGFFVTETNWLTILRCIKKKKNLMLIGPAGTGKTQIVSLAAKKMNLPLHCFDMGTTQDPISTLLGTHRLKNGESIFDYARFARVIQEPGIVLLDELSRAPATSNNILFPVLDDRRFLPIEQAGTDNDLPIAIHPECIFIATANINGIGGHFSGTNQLDKAMVDRFPLKIEMEFPQPQIEALILMKKTGVDKSNALLIANTAQAIRQSFENGDLEETISLRETSEIADLITDGMSYNEASSAVLLPLFEKDSRATIRSIIFSN